MKEQKLSPQAEAALLRLTRDALSAAIKGTRYEASNPEQPELDAECGCFVTLRTSGDLRGCIGCFTSEDPLWKTAATYSRLSALEDPRFAGRRIRPEELDKVDISVSVLSPLEPCAAPEEITLGVHGIYVKGRGRSGCFLPSVARDTGWNLEEFWGHCCQDKAGLPWDAWKTPGTELYTFTATEVKE